MYFVTVGILILALAYVQVNGNDFDQFQKYQKARINGQYPVQTNHIRKFCQQNICTESERQGLSTNRCITSSCIKRALQEDVGPFWANRGKKDPTYRHDTLYAEEPHWVLVRRAQDRLTPLAFDFDPFFVTRGKKDDQDLDKESKDIVESIFAKMHIRNRRDSKLRITEAGQASSSKTILTNDAAKDGERTSKGHLKITTKGIYRTSPYSIIRNKQTSVKMCEPGNPTQVAKASIAEKNKQSESTKDSIAPAGSSITSQDISSREEKPRHPRITYENNTMEEGTSHKWVNMELRTYSDYDQNPHYKNYQLLGDSQLLRFSEQLLGFKRFLSYTGHKVRGLGYCVSGQTIYNLKMRLIRNEYELSKKVIMLIGTNDILQGKPIQQMRYNYNSILSMLKLKTDRIVLLTVPPLPKLVLAHDKILLFNEFIKTCADGDKVSVIDITKQYINSNYEIPLEYFEKTCGREERVDLIHLNRKGFMLLKAVLDNNLEEDA